MQDRRRRKAILTARSASAARGRTNLNIHECPSDPVQRLFVAVMRDSYFRPHRHAGKGEFALVLRGFFDVVLFDEDGRVAERVRVGPSTGVMGFDMPAGVWHSWVPGADGSVFFEVKQGPYDPATASEFAPWAPAENTPGVPAFLDWLRRAVAGEQEETGGRAVRRQRLL
jgi:cupin fold WbuC family metalloprotein